MAEELRISDYIYPLTQFGRAGRIHTVFPYSFNLQINDQLINVSSFFDYVASYGLYVPQKSFQLLRPYVQVDDFVKVTPEKLVFYSQKGIYSFPIAESQRLTLDMKTLTVGPSDLRKLREVLVNQGLEEKLGLPLDARAQAVFKQMREVSAAPWGEIVAYLVGRGGGGTPSGDDILVAYLAVLHATKAKETLAVLRRALDIPLATPDVSRAYLLAAMEGYVNSLIYHLFAELPSLDEKAVEQQVQGLMAIGHSSGKDLSFGLLLGIEHLLSLDTVKK